jgi:hypothetical protein
MRRVRSAVGAKMSLLLKSGTFAASARRILCAFRLLRLMSGKQGIHVVDQEVSADCCSIHVLWLSQPIVEEL